MVIYFINLMDAEYPYQDKPNRWSSHSVIAQMLEGLPHGARVLDVGVASGMLARLCAGRGYVMHGVEPNPVNLAGTQHLYAELSTQSLEQTSDEFLADHDAVVLGDVLEHLVSPDYQLKRLASLQDQDCLFIVSVPNIANIWIRFTLLLGKFDYTDRGILDHTHLHFYTRKTFLAFLREAGLEVDKINSTPIPLDLVSTFFSNHFIGRGLYTAVAQLATWWPTMFAYQFAAKAYKVDQK